MSTGLTKLFDGCNYHYPPLSKQSIYNSEELTALELASRTAFKVDEIVDWVNQNIEILDVTKNGVKGDYLDSLGNVNPDFTDDTNAIKELITKDVPIFFPYGYYYVNEWLDLTNAYGFGFIVVLGDTDYIPVEDIQNDLTLKIPSIVPTMDDALTYIKRRRIRQSLLTIQFANGNFFFNDNICPCHPDGQQINILGQGVGNTTLTFDFTGKEGQGTGAFALEGEYHLGLINGFTIDGNNWSGRTGGPPINNDGDPDDPIGVLARNGATIKLGSDILIRFMARNGVLTYLNGTIECNGINVEDCGSDAFVASTGGSTLCNDTEALRNYGFGYYCDYGGSMWADNSKAHDTLKRNGVGGSGYGANFNGMIVARNSEAKRNDGDGYLTLTGMLHIDDSVSGGSVSDGNTVNGLRCQANGKVFAQDLTLSYNGEDGLNDSQGGGFYGNNLISSNNTENGVYVGAGSNFESSNAQLNDNTIDGLQVENGGICRIFGLTANNNGDDGISCVNSRISGITITQITGNTNNGIIARRGGVVDISATASTVVTGNGTDFSPAVDTTNGIDYSRIYTLS